MAVIRNSVTHELDLTEAKLSEANCQMTDFKGSRFFKTNLMKTDLCGASNYTIHPTENIFKQTRMSLPDAKSMLYQLDIVFDY